ncbi:MAG: SCO family protein [Granulosicoccus sp.]
MNESGSTTNPGQVPDMPIDPELRRRSRLKLLIIFALFAVPLLAATVYLQIVRMSGGTVGDTSRGQLIQPAVPLTEFTLMQGGESVTLDTFRGSWTMLYLPAGECLDACRLNLYHMRQVRLALNHRMDRVQRAVVLETAAQLDSNLREEHNGLIIATGNNEEIAGFRSQITAAQAAMDPLDDAIYLIDPLGNLMLRFAPDLPPESMLKDLKHLLKVSRIG